MLPPRRFSIEGDHTARARRAIAGRRLYDEMSRMIFDTSATNMTLFEALQEARHVHGCKAEAVEDVKREPMTYDRLVIASLALGKPLGAAAKQREAVGLLMPNVSGVVAALFALQSSGRAGHAQLQGWIDQYPRRLHGRAGPHHRQCRAFVTQAKLTDLVSALEADGLQFL